MEHFFYTIAELITYLFVEAIVGVILIFQAIFLKPYRQKLKAKWNRDLKSKIGLIVSFLFSLSAIFVSIYIVVKFVE